MESECSVEGDPDLYGLGVRIASYVTWLTTIVAYHIFPEKTVSIINPDSDVIQNLVHTYLHYVKHDSLIVNCILQFSLLIATIYKIAAGTANTGEVYLMTVLGVGGGFAFLMEMAIMKTAREHRHLWCLPWFHSIPFADILRSLLFFAYMILSQWFWNGGRFTLVSH